MNRLRVLLALTLMLMAGLLCSRGHAAEPTVIWSGDGATLTLTPSLPAPAQEAAVTPVEATAENIAASVPNERFGRALKRASRWLRLSGKVDKETRQKIVEFVDCPERTTADGEVVNLLEMVKVATVEQMVEEGQRGARVGFDFMELLDWIIENWDTIYAIIQALLILFA